MKQEIPYSSAQLLYYAWQLSRNRGGADDDKLTGVLSEARVDLNPHQVMAALFAFQSPFSKGVILADEVGLGKTIEAGIVISQFWAERKRRILIVAPATLRRQWSMELEEKFFLDSFILEKKKGISLDHLSDGKQIYICSYQFASRQAEILSRTHWDLVVYDEAHKLRNVYKSTPSMASRLKSAFSDSHKLLLTATPLQNNIEELYGLVSIIDDHYFGDLKSFKAQYCYSNKNDDIAFGDLRRRLRPIVHRTLRKQVTEYVKYTSRIPMAQEYYPAVEEQKLYNQISEYLRRDDTYGLPTSQRQLITLIFRKLMSSSTFAIGYTLKTLIDRLQTKIAPYSADKQQGWYGEDEKIAMVAEDMLGDDWDEWNEQDENELEGEILTPNEIEGIKDEIKELQRLYDLANSISSNKKGDCLLSALHTGFQKMEELGANRKALIFTESTRTQLYLKQLLEENGYMGKIVLFNGSNNDETSRKIYKAWKERNIGTSAFSPSLSANKRQAIVDYFRDEADRYGQKNDVVVFNFINKANAADVRVFQLLSEKFHLFDGVFGSSDEVLGSIESGVDFEKRMLNIYQQCRTPEEINAAFDQIQQEMDASIKATMQDTRKQLLENFDEDVVGLLKIRQGKDMGNLNKFHRWLWTITIATLGKENVEVVDETNLVFRLKHNPYPDVAAECGIYQITTLQSQYINYRLSHPLAQKVIALCKQNEQSLQNLLFDYSLYRYKVADIEQCAYESGWLQAHLVSFISEGQQEQHIVLTALAEDGTALGQEFAEKLLNIPSECTGKVRVQEEASQKLASLYDNRRAALTVQIEERNKALLDTEIQHIEKWAEDQQLTLENELKDIKAKIKEKKRLLSRSENAQQTLTLEKELNTLTRQQKRKRAEIFNLEDEIEEKRDGMIDKVKAFIQQHITEEELFCVHWALKK
ncbi:MAG TPA: SNF2-related protein [Prevotella sp.]|nr:SNF2-related protein [Prevotella sp.]